MKNLSSLIESIVYRNLDPGARDWLTAKAASVREETGGTQLALAFTAMPRKTGKKDPGITEAEQQEAERDCKGLYIKDWTLDRLARVWLLMQADPADKNAYLKKIENLFSAAEMNELVALYSALPVLAYPEEWRGRCAEGIRSNIGIVLDAIIHRNPYPAEWLEEPAWNQLVMKAFFTDKDIRQISGLEKRANKALSAILSDYARERQAAGRSVKPELREIEKLGGGGQ
ncbi:MAG: EboA domain-containing protein [Puia sp.]|nr:EboA domain-containing protein [Puia sp.]